MHFVSASDDAANFLTVNIIDNPLTAVQISQNKIYEHGDAYKDAISKFANNPLLYIWELDEPNIDKLLDRLEKICAKLDKPPIVCIDYLQILAVGSENIKSSIDEVLHKILAFRRKTNTTFIIVSSLNRANYNTEISFESFKESGGVEYGNRPFSKNEKEALKEAIDQSNNWEELLAVAIASLSLGNGYPNR